MPELSLQLIVFCFFCLSILILLWYYLFYFSRVSFHKDLSPSPLSHGRGVGGEVPASIIICAKNEDHNLPEFLPLMLSQDYPEYEVVVVDDCSSDNTTDVLREFEKKYLPGRQAGKNLRVITLKEDVKHHHGKKFAVMVGIKGARHEHLLFTDADCKPLDNQWLKKMMRNFSGSPSRIASAKPASAERGSAMAESFSEAERRTKQGETEIVLGYSKYEKLPGLLNKLIRFDTFHIALQYLSFAQAGSPYMGVGRNLAYKKSIFFKHKGFAAHYHIESGDDDLFINQAATKTNTCVEISPQSFIESRVKKNFNEWVEQKRRHLTTWTSYKLCDKIRLGIYPFAQLFFWLSFCAMMVLSKHPIFSEYDLYLVLGLAGCRFIAQFIIFKLAMDKLNEKDLLLFSLAGELFLLGFYPALTLSNKLFRRKKWKSI